MPNRSLQDALLDEKCAGLTEWTKRFNIVVDIERGPSYLHHLCSPPVVHGDINPNNILLDADFKAKIGDFDSEASPENVAMVVSPEGGVNKASTLKRFFDKISLDSGKDLIGNGRKNMSSKRDWWWKQDSGGDSHILNNNTRNLEISNSPCIELKRVPKQHFH
nr:receptor-like serine/threonine-protein kinase [Quercus suber]